VSHEDELFEVLRKVGQVEAESASAPSMLDSDLPDTKVVQTVEGPDVLPEPAHQAPSLPEDTYAPISSRNLFVHHDAHPVVFDVKLLQQYGENWMVWEPETLWREIMDDFRVPSISDHAKSKIQAVKTLHINEWYFDKWEVFCWVTQALNNNIPDFQVIQKPSIAQLFVSVDIATMVRGDEEFGAETQMWVAASVLDEGVIYAPKPIAFCNDEIVQLLERSKLEDALGLIPAVQERWRELGGLSEEAWGKINGAALEENAVDVQVAKLIVAQRYMELRRRQLKEQLRILR
jgi:hypothetical protein